MQAPNQTSFFLTWGSFEFLKMEQSYKYKNFAAFLAELGGSLGIWLGLSVLSLLQGSVFLTQKATKKIKGGKKSDKVTDSKATSDRKFSDNPFGKGGVSANPFAGVMGPNRKLNKQY